VDPQHADHVHEPSSTMTVPLIVLAGLSIVTGYLGIPEFLQLSFSGAEGGDIHHGAAATGIMVAASLAGLLGIAAAYVLYVKSPDLPDRLMNRWRLLYQLSLNKWYVDEAYDRTIVNPTFQIADQLWKRVDVRVIDGAVNGIARGVAWCGWVVRLIQSGQVQHYALGMTLGAVVFLSAYLVF